MISANREVSLELEQAQILPAETDTVFAKSLDSKREKLDVVVAELENVLVDEDFVVLQNSFFSKYHEKFDKDLEENKLIYTEIFNEYTSEIEAFINEKVKLALPWFEMKEFMALLKAYPDNAEGDVFELLDTLGDFEAFKQEIFGFKDDLTGKNKGLKSLLSVSAPTKTI